ncbi:MAG: putative galactarate transporter [Spirochaetes bacterium ADurb.Bin315]|mgnify:CR=1 FL=1|jgi:MFS family permease|nr:MAG: putative galactarate transporter [Spirochaetes bacterium ADurb.Bin315]
MMKIMRSVRVYRYRWVMLISLINLVLAGSLQWLNFAPVGRIVNAYYRDQIHLRFFNPIDLLSLTYLIVYVLFSIPSGWIIRKLGMRVTYWIASGLIIFGAMTKTLYLSSFKTVLFGQILLGLAQTFTLTSITETTSRWFPIRERGVAVGIIQASQYLSLALVMILSPLFVVRSQKGIEQLMRLWAIISILLAAVSAALVRERPPSPSSTFEREEEMKFSQALTSAFSRRSLRILIMEFATSWAVLMTVFIKIDEISEFLGFANSNGILAITMLIFGMVSAVVIPALSDRFRKRKVFYTFCALTAVPGSFLLLSGNITVALIGAAILGSGLLASIPIGSQYATELGHGINEKVIQALLQFFSQLATVVILFVTTIIKERYQLVLPAILATILLGTLIATFFIKESEVIVTEDERLKALIELENVQH